MTEENNLILQLKETDNSSYGGKADGLIKLHQLGLNIPESYIVHSAWQNNDSREKHINHFVNKKGEGPFAVRSSSSGEDGQIFSAAGQFQTFLGVKGAENLHKAIKRPCEVLSGNHRRETETRYVRYYTEHG